jgi:hypothetical protein
LTPLAFANALRIGSSRPVYVAGFERREPRIAVWSSTVTSSCRRARHPWMSEVFPEPATPVTTQSTPSGTSTVRSRRLCSVACSTRSAPAGSRTVSFSLRTVEKWRPVMVSDARRPGTSPSKTTVPPCTPAPGPMSTTRSAIAITCGSCSTTSTVLPLSRNLTSSRLTRRMSCGCSPTVGSSKT